MDKARKKELKEQYKVMKPDMGVFMISSRVTKKCHIQATKDLKGVINGSRAKLQAGVHPNLELRQEWKELGSENFTIEILEHLDYQEDKEQADYSDELAILQMEWEEKLLKDGWQLYKKRIRAE
jgi:hypothetical protein